MAVVRRRVDRGRPDDVRRAPGATTSLVDSRGATPLLQTAEHTVDLLLALVMEGAGVYSVR